MVTHTDCFCCCIGCKARHVSHICEILSCSSSYSRSRSRTGFTCPACKQSVICNMDVTIWVTSILQIRLFGLMVVLGVVDTVKAVLRTNKYVCASKSKAVCI